MFYGDQIQHRDKMDVFREIGDRFVPRDVLTKYVYGVQKTSGDFWEFRKEFTRQYGMHMVLSYVMGIPGRLPHRIWVSRKGKVTMMDMVVGNNMETQEQVPFRLTPNIQNLMGSIGIEGVLISTIVSVSRAMVENGFPMEDMLVLFARDEFVSRTITGKELLGAVLPYVENVYQRLTMLACMREQTELQAGTIQRMVRQIDQNSKADPIVPMNQRVVELVSRSMDPQRLCEMDPCWHPWF